MSVRYLLPCSCGESVSVAPSQAGGTVVCPSCGNSLETPRLRDLVQLPVEETEAVSSAGWSPRQGVLTAGLLLAATLAGLGAWAASNEPAPQAPVDLSAREAMVEKNLDQLSATDLWRSYYAFYEPMTRLGLQQQESPRDAALREAILASQLNQSVLFIAAGVIAAAAFVLFALMPK